MPDRCTLKIDRDLANQISRRWAGGTVTANWTDTARPRQTMFWTGSSISRPGKANSTWSLEPRGISTSSELKPSRLADSSNSRASWITSSACCGMWAKSCTRIESPAAAAGGAKTVQSTASTSPPGAGRA